MADRFFPATTSFRDFRADDEPSTTDNKPPRGDEPPFVALRLLSETGRAAIEIDQPLAIVGRHSGADVRLSAPDVSRRHCELAFDGGVWQVRDLASTNGVYVNGEPVRSAPLYIGDRVRIGGATFVVERATPRRGPVVGALRSIARAFEEA